MELQRDISVEGLRRGIGEIEDLDAIEMRDVVVRFHDEQIIIPVGGMNDGLVFGRRPGDPLPAIAVQPPGMVIQGRIDFD